MNTRVLVVDDNPGDRLLLCSMLQQPGFGDFDVLEARSGQEGITVVQDDGVDCMLLDYMMPEMNGLETLREIRRLAIDIPVVFITEYGDEHLIHEAMQSGATNFIIKSNANGSLLASTIASAIYLKRSRTR